MKSNPQGNNVAEVYTGPGQAFELCYPNHLVARGTITSVFPDSCLNIRI